MSRDQYLSLTSAADELGVSVRTLRRYIAAGRLPAYRVGPRNIRVMRSDVDKLARRVPAVGYREAA